MFVYVKNFMFLVFTIFKHVQNNGWIQSKVNTSDVYYQEAKYSLLTREELLSTKFKLNIISFVSYST